jgi:ATP-grasp ribosomal peptide maturase
MADSRSVLVVTNLDDPTADLVIEELNARGVPVMRLDTGDFPAEVQMAAFTARGHERHWRGRLETPTRTACLESVRALYFRRPSGFVFPDLSDQDARFAVAQARYGLGGVLTCLPDCLYVNHPNRIGDAEYKPVQLAVASRLGFNVPATLITNEPETARAFAKEHAPVVYKPLAVPPYVVAEASCTVLTTEVEPDDIDDTVAGTAHMFQARVAKVADARVTVIGAQAFSVRIDSGMLDWRADYAQLTYSVVNPPAGIEGALHAYLRSFGLVFGAFDFAIAADGSWHFLECNPSGQWAFLETPTGLPLTASMPIFWKAGAHESRPDRRRRRQVATSARSGAAGQRGSHPFSRVAGRRGGGATP